MVQCDSDPTCVAMDVSGQSGDTYICTLYFGSTDNFTTTGSSGARCYKKLCHTTSTTTTRTTTATSTSFTETSTTSTHPDADQPEILLKTSCPYTLPRFSHRGRCCIFGGLSPLGENFTFFQLETCVNMCNAQESCVALDYSPELDGSCRFHRLYNTSTTAFNETYCIDDSDMDQGWECHRRFCDTTTTSYTTQTVTTSTGNTTTTITETADSTATDTQSSRALAVSALGMSATVAAWSILRILEG